MKNSIIFFVAIFALTSCGDVQRPEYVCNCQQKPLVAKFVEDHIKDANNMSDEEMEDVISQLHRTAVSIHCDQRLFWQARDGGAINWEKERLDSCETIMIYF